MMILSDWQRVSTHAECRMPDCRMRIDAKSSSSSSSTVRTSRIVRQQPLDIRPVAPRHDRPCRSAAQHAARSRMLRLRQRPGRAGCCALRQHRRGALAQLAAGSVARRIRMRQSNFAATARRSRRNAQEHNACSPGIASSPAWQQRSHSSRASGPAGRRRGAPFPPSARHNVRKYGERTEERTMRNPR